MHGDERMSGEGLEARDGVDERINAALRRYAEAPEFSEPRVALARVRALAEEEPRRQWSAWAWVVPSAVVAALIGLVVVWALRVPQRPQIAWVPRAPGVAAEGPRAGSNSGAGSSRINSSMGKSVPQGLKPHALAARNGTTEVVPLQSARPSTALRGKEPRQSSAQDDRGVEVARRLPKMEVFPTPQPLSAEERALLALATQAPPDVTKQVIEAQEHLGDPIQIAAITIRPLNEDEQQSAPKGKEMR